MAEVRFSENAMRDAESIAACIARDPDLHASVQVECFLKDADRLRTFPRGGRIVLGPREQSAANDRSKSEETISPYNAADWLWPDVVIDPPDTLA